MGNRPGGRFGNHSRAGRGLVHFSAGRALLSVKTMAEKWTRPLTGLKRFWLKGGNGMKLFALSVCAVALLGTQVAMAQNSGPAGESRVEQEEPWNHTSVGQVDPTPEMWFYEQYQKQYDDPQRSVREKAEFRTVQRQRRLAARRWFGLSNARPQASSDPFNGGDYSARWTSNNGYYPSRWTAWGGGWIVPRVAD